MAQPSFFGLPSKVKSLIQRHKGISELYDWQVECLNLPSVKKKKNLIYSLPTSGGKTLVAEILILRELLLERKNVLFILPYVSIVLEKVNALSQFGVELDFLVEEYAGSKGCFPPQKRRRKKTVFVATIEKALGLVNSLIECQRLREIGLVVIDEVHLIGEASRGALLENLLIKVLHSGVTQIVGMSATIGNINELGQFLRADIYSRNFRPTELKEYIKIKDELFLHLHGNDPPLAFVKKLPPELSAHPLDPDGVAHLVFEDAPNSPCLVFCPSKSNCENVALMLIKVLDMEALEKCSSHAKVAKKQLMNALKAEGDGHICPTLLRTLPLGIAYHHSGLTTAERKLIEEAYVMGTIFCICCTSTLAAGVNLPAQRVLLRSPYVGQSFITLSRYKQMVGRAGRAGKQIKGESFLICSPFDVQKVGALLSSQMEDCQSQLVGEELSNFLLSSFHLGLCWDLPSALMLIHHSLLKIQEPSQKLPLEVEVQSVIKSLVEAGSMKATPRGYVLSPLGVGAVKGNLSLECAKELYSDALKILKCMVLAGNLHLLFLVTPYSLIDQISVAFDVFNDLYSSLKGNDLKVLELIGVQESTIAHLYMGLKIKPCQRRLVGRFYISLILNSLWNGATTWAVQKKFKISRGVISSLLSSTASFAGAVSRFCESFPELWAIPALLTGFPQKLAYCCTTELLPLMELAPVKLGRARQLYSAGFKTVQTLAGSEPKLLTQKISHLSHKQATQIIAAAKLKLITQYESLQDEAAEVFEALKDSGA